MENLLDYLLYALFGHEVTDVFKNASSGYGALNEKTWTIVFEGSVYITIGESDLKIIRCIYENREERLDAEERARYMRIFDLCK